MEKKQAYGAFLIQAKLGDIIFVSNRETYVICRNIDRLDMYPGDIVGLAGKNGKYGVKKLGALQGMKKIYGLARSRSERDSLVLIQIYGDSCFGKN